MYKRPLVPLDFAVPERLDTPHFRLRPLRLADAERDYEAVMESAARLRGFMDPDDAWPDGLTLHDNRVDLGWHEREFTLRHSFAYTVVSPDEARCLGCAYLYPSDRAGHDAMAFWWVRESVLAEGLDAELGAVFRAFLAERWPLPRIAFPGRDIAWAEWRSLPPAWPIG